MVASNCRSRAGCAAAPRTSPHCCCWRCSCASSFRSWRDTSSTIRSAGPTRSACCAGSGACLWGAAFVLREKDEVRFDIFYSAASEKTRCVFTVITGVAAIVLFAHRAARGLQLRDLPEGREVRLSRHPPRLSLFDLHRVLGRRHRALCGADLARHSRPARPTSRSGAGRRLMTSPFATLYLRHPWAWPARIADRLFDDRRLDPLSAAGGPRSRNVGRADPERPLQQLRAARGAAVSVLGRADERQQDDRPAAALLRHAGRPLPRRSRPHQHRAEHHLCRHVGLGDRRPRRRPAASAST